MSRADAAKEYFMKGYACAQAVLLAFSDVTGLESEIALKISLPFGGGMGRLRLTCGTVSGAVMVLGTVFSKAEINPENKKEVYAAVQEFSGRFKAENGSVVCGELLTGAHLKADIASVPEARSAEYYRKRPCPELVYSAAKILEEYLGERGKLDGDALSAGKH